MFSAGNEKSYVPADFIEKDKDPQNRGSFLK